MQFLSHIAEDLGDALLFRGADVGQGAAGLEDLADGGGGSALGHSGYRLSAISYQLKDARGDEIGDR
jgi:hypothetical protein